MSKARKPSIPKDGRPVPPLTRLKLAVAAMPIEQAEQLYSLLDSMSGSEWRAHVARTLGINLSSDSKVTIFRGWFQDYQDLQDFNAAMERDEAELANSGKTAEEIRELVIRKAYARAEAKRDSELSMKVLDRDLSMADARRKDKELALKTEALAQAERKLKLLEAKAAEIKDVVNSTLSPEEQRARLKEILA